MIPYTGVYIEHIDGSIDNFKLFGHIIGNIKVDVTKNYHVGETYNLFDDFGL